MHTTKDTPTSIIFGFYQEKTPKTEYYFWTDRQSPYI